VPTDSRSAYRLANRHTKDELKWLIEQAVRPLGPMLTQVPDATTDQHQLAGRQFSKFPSMASRNGR